LQENDMRSNSTDLCSFPIGGWAILEWLFG